MAAVLHSTSALLPPFRLPVFRQTLLGSLNVLRRPMFNGFSFGALGLSLNPLLELLPPFLLAVPKKKTSHSKKAMRSSAKGLKDKTNLVNCPACGRPKLAHNLCPHCYSELSRGYKREARERAQFDSSSEGPTPVS